MSTRSTVCCEVVNDGVNGYLCPSRNIAALVEKMELILNLDQKQLAEMGRASRRMAEERFDESIVIEAYMNAVDVAINGECIEKAGYP